MKKWYAFLCFLLINSFVSYGQNVYQHFSELNGMEDYNGNTNLLYRIYSSSQDSFNYGYGNSIYLLNITDNTDSLFQSDFSSYNYYTGGFSRGISSYDFWEKDPRKFIVCGDYCEADPTAFIDKFDNRDRFMPIIGGGTFIRISRQNDSLVYATFNNRYFYKSTTGGVSWDTAGNFNAVSLSPYNDKVLFTTEYNKIIKTIDGGLTKIVVDSIPLDVYRTASFFYDKDTDYIYSTEYYYNLDHNVYNFLVSNNSGNANSWQVKLTSTLPMYLTVDNNVAGSVYLATGKYIYHFIDFGNTFSLLQTFDKSIVGIYKKPASFKLYAATYNTIYEIDGSKINIIKHIPIDPEIFKYYPLDMGNKWVYSGKYIVPKAEYHFVHSEEIIRDTVLENQKNFKLIRIEEVSSNSSSVYYSMKRIDSLTGKVYSWNLLTKLENQSDDLSINLGDTIYVSRLGLDNVPTSFDSSNTKSIFGLTKENHVFNSSTNSLGYGDRYSLTKDLGMTNDATSGDQVLNTLNLKGAIIKGITYGDTSFVIDGIADKNTFQPKEYILSQNYPNPFNPITMINYSLAKAGNIKLTVFNAIGSKVATILNEYKPAGNYSVQFNASNLASGIYLYRLESGNYAAVKKFIILK